MSCPSILLDEALVIGVDEAGRGPLAGPVVAAAVMLGPDAPHGLADSKVLSAKRRAELDPRIRLTCRWGIGVVEASEPAISAASILAKQHRDAIMQAAAQQWPHYGWDRNAGYGTREHLDALHRHGPCPLHRRSYRPVAHALLP